MSSYVEQAAEYLGCPDRLAYQLGELLYDGFSSVFVEPDVMDGNLATTILVGYSDRYKITWTVAGKPITGFGFTSEQESFSRSFTRIADVIELARSYEPDAFQGIEVSVLKDFAKAVIRVRSGVEDSSPQLGVLRNKILGQLDFLGNSIKLKLTKVIVANKADSRVDVASGESSSGPGPQNEATETGDPKGQSDGPCEDSNMFRIGGQRVGPFTDTEFDVLNLMWEHRDSPWPQKDAHFKFYESFGWPQVADGSPFGRHQTSIKKSFNSSGLGLPWKLKRGAFHWLGAEPLKVVSER